MADNDSRTEAQTWTVGDAQPGDVNMVIDKGGYRRWCLNRTDQVWYMRDVVGPVYTWPELVAVAGPLTEARTTPVASSRPPVTDTMIHAPRPADTLKMIRETLCVAQTHLNLHDVSSRRQEHSDRIGRLIADIDRQRPLGPDGKHGDRHTSTCGCDDAERPPVADNDQDELRTAHLQVDRSIRRVRELEGEAGRLRSELEHARETITSMHGAIDSASHDLTAFQEGRSDIAISDVIDDLRKEL